MCVKLKWAQFPGVSYVAGCSREELMAGCGGPPPPSLGYSLWQSLWSHLQPAGRAPTASGAEGGVSDSWFPLGRSELGGGLGDFRGSHPPWKDMFQPWLGLWSLNKEFSRALSRFNGSDRTSAPPRHADTCDSSSK